MKRKPIPEQSTSHLFAARATVKPDPARSLSFEEHGRILRALRSGGSPDCPKCGGSFEVRFPGGYLSAVCLDCRLAVRELGSTVGAEYS